MLPQHPRYKWGNASSTIVKGSFREELTLPSLFWRIDEAEQSRQGRGASVAVYRAEVMRNLRWLLNSSAARSADNLWNYGEAASSVINYGIPPYSGRMGSAIDAEEMADAIRAAILRFEPRIVEESLKVERLKDRDNIEGNSLAFRISGSIWSQPVPERFSMETNIDTTSGNWNFSL